MAESTNQVAGLSSGFDWRTMIDKLMTVEHRRVDLVTAKKKESESKLAQWQTVNTKLLTLKTAATSLKGSESFGVFRATMTSDSSTIEASDLLAVTPSSSASVGSYTLTDISLAAAQKLSSGSFAAMSDPLGAGYAGDLLINGKVISIAATDTLASVRDKINDANSGASPTGVTAGIVSYGTSDYRMILTSDATGISGMGLLNGGATDLLRAFGFTDSSRTAKNHLAGGDRTDRFSRTDVSIKSLLGLSTTQTSGVGDIVINGQSLGAVDLSTDTLTSLQTKLTAAGLTASITTETENNQTLYRLMVSGGANTYTDKNNILETLGLIKGGVADVQGMTGDVANTAGGNVITAETLIKDIDGYTGYLNTDYIHLEGTDTDNDPIADDTLVLSDATTVGDLLAKVEDLFGDVTASITGEGKLQIVANGTGASPLAVRISVKNAGGSDDTTLKFDTNGDLGSAALVRERELVAGADASLLVDGVAVSRSTNTIADIIPGVTLNLLKTDEDTTVTLNIGRDIDAITAKINTFVSSYNSVSSLIREQTSYDASTGKPGGVLFGDGTLTSVKASLASTLVQNVWGVSADFSTMGLIGVNVDKTGQLTVDSDVLRGHLTSNFNDVRKLFIADGTADVGTLEYVGHSIDTEQGDHAVHITAAATQSHSAASNNTSLAGDETLTITSGSSAAVVHLLASMTMAQMVNTVNSELATTYAQVLAGAEQLYADDAQNAEISAQTTWNSVYDSTGASANLADDDVISFSGKKRSGADVSGSYTISAAATDTIQGLLTAIQSAFNNEVTAMVNSSGRIVVTDKTSGASGLELTFDYTQAHDLDFGQGLASNPDGQEGRYAFDITASADAGNHMVLTHNKYGTGNDFTIHQAGNLLWTGGDQTVDNGVDVAGTINGQAATGVGQVLTGNSGEATIDGLSVKYTGDGVGDVGTVTLTYGVAELFDRALFSITDTYDGYVAFKRDSLQNQISHLGDRIEDMEALLAKKQELLTNKYIAMELTLGKLQNQSAWLAGQIDALFTGYGS